VRIQGPVLGIAVYGYICWP